MAYGKYTEIHSPAGKASGVFADIKEFHDAI